MRAGGSVLLHQMLCLRRSCSPDCCCRESELQLLGKAEHRQPLVPWFLPWPESPLDGAMTSPQPKAKGHLVGQRPGSCLGHQIAMKGQVPSSTALKPGTPSSVCVRWQKGTQIQHQQSPVTPQLSLLYSYTQKSGLQWSHTESRQPKNT